MTFNPRDPAQLDALMDRVQTPTCIADDYITVQKDVVPALIAEVKRLREVLERIADDTDMKHIYNPAYSNIVDYAREALKTEETK